MSQDQEERPTAAPKVLVKGQSRIERGAWQITGVRDGKEGVWLRLLEDASGQAVYDLRFLGYNEARSVHRPSSHGVVLNSQSLRLLLQAIHDCSAQAQKLKLS